MFSEPSLQWFLMPSEAHEMLERRGQRSRGTPGGGGPVADDGQGAQMIYPKQYTVETEVVFAERNPKATPSGTKRKSIAVAAHGPPGGGKIPAAEKDRKRPRRAEGKTSLRRLRLLRLPVKHLASTHFENPETSRKNRSCSRGPSTLRRPTWRRTLRQHYSLDHPRKSCVPSARRLPNGI